MARATIWMGTFFGTHVVTVAFKELQMNSSSHSLAQKLAKIYSVSTRGHPLGLFSKGERFPLGVHLARRSTVPKATGVSTLHIGASAARSGDQRASAATALKMLARSTGAPHALVIAGSAAVD